MKINTFLNIAACNIKVKDFGAAAAACNEVFKLDPTNLRAYYRRARATALPVNAGVPEFRKAVKDIDKLLSLVQESKDANAGKAKNFRTDYISKERERLLQLIQVNSKRERDTYSKMFTAKVSVAEEVQKQMKANPAPQRVKSTEELELEGELSKLRKEVFAASKVRMKDFSFEIKDEWYDAQFPELEDIQQILNETVETYRLLKKGGQF